MILVSLTEFFVPGDIVLSFNKPEKQQCGVLQHAAWCGPQVLQLWKRGWS